MSNCLIFAVSLWFRHGGYLVIRKSKHGWWPHFLWSQNLETYRQFVPVVPAHSRLLPPIVFRGRVLESSAKERP